MLKHFIYSAIASAAMTAALSSCAGEDIVNPVPDPIGEGNVTLTFTNSSPSRAIASDGSMNEDLISQLDLFFYTDDADDNAAPVATRTVTGINANATATVKVSLSKQETDALFSNSTEGATCRMVAIANRPDGVNIPADQSVASLRNIIVGSDFAHQDGESAQPSFVMFGDTEEARTGNTKITFKTGQFGGSASGNVMLVRAASRIRFSAEVREEVVVTESVDGSTTTEYWRPDISSMAIILNNGVDNSTLEPSTATAAFDKNYFTLDAVTGQFGPGESFTEDGVNYLTTDSKSVFYTYPNQWEISPSETHRTTLTIALPWHKHEMDADGELQPVPTFRTCYYKVPMTKGTEIVRNTDYSVTMRIDMLGSFTIEEPLEWEGSYETVDWSDVTTDVSIKDYRYLVVNQNNFTIDNAPSISIPFYSSHPVEVKSIVMRYKRFNTQNDGNGDVATITVTEAQNDATGTHNNGQKVFTYQITKDNAGNNVLVVNHELKAWRAYGQYTTGSGWWAETTTGTIPETGYSSIANAESTLNGAQYYTPTNGTAYSPYEFIVTIVHSDEKNNDQTHWQETLTITQYPGMYIEVDPNPGTPSSNPTTDAQYGYVWVNNGRGPTNGSYFNAVRGLNGSNKNPNMYVITVNTLTSQQEDYIIDDPRFFYRNNLNVNPNTSLAMTTTEDNAASASRNANTYCYPAYSLYPTQGASRTLTWYYPTRETTDYSNVIAPKLRIASSYGVCASAITRSQARQRCATYQEAGYPAGRWRLPTVGEFEFIVNLSQEQKIPLLFTKGTTRYLTAQGWVQIPNNNNPVTLTPSTNQNTSGYVRCVYDEWYWGNVEERYRTVPLTQSTYGDMEKTNPEGGVK